ncbi:undecaprenyl-diphosphate phosphatase [Hujiaoplasma nucleasis]|uniref:Undecaprenyl-diphosphatase n=1 Tax=Hujiaoplasma nucleasis TaxID=2725268 RepID=A0A7L6N841_9MOLU|nr:undecaprenyl-diphosphate phosphatase [Hujiaoplasma nucleasis]QLY40699.1 undecaprenyl-diphosphate phosphatase [Hujiaoplasma nucleasis]
MDLLELVRYILYGIVQGIFEVLPISSSGQVAFIQFIVNDQFEYSQFFLIVVNLGSLFALIVYFRKNIKELLCHTYLDLVKKKDNPEYKKSSIYLKNILIAIIPIGILGTILTLSGIDIANISLIIIGVGALLTGTILYLSRHRTDLYTSTKVTAKKAWVIGLFQILALIPGVSRLAVTATAGTQQELSYNTALKFSLLMSIPISLGSILVYVVRGFVDIHSLLDFDTSLWYMYFYYFTSMFISFFGTLYALKFIFIITQKGNFRMFYVYNVIFGLIALLIGIIRY